jgi:hypothetical protein
MRSNKCIATVQGQVDKWSDMNLPVDSVVMTMEPRR